MKEFKKSIFFGLACIFCGGVVFSGYFVIKAYEDISSFKAYGNCSKNKIYDRNGSLIDIFGGEVTGDLKIKDTPKFLINSIIEVEDKNFWTNYGIDINGIVRAAIDYIPARLSRRRPTGGSTITQQTMRLVFLRDHSLSFFRKFKETIYSLVSNFILSKEQILEAYMNHAYFGNNIIGFKEAAYCLFGETLNNLGHANLAILTACLKDPLLWENEEKCAIRRDYVLRRMRRKKLISEENYQKGIYENIVIKFSHPKDIFFSIKAILKDFSPIEKEGGLDYHLTIDSDLQETVSQKFTSAVIDFEEKEQWMGPVSKDVHLNTNNYVLVKILNSEGVYSGLGANGILTADQKQKYIAIKEIEMGDRVILTKKNRRLVNLPSITGQVSMMDLRNGEILAYAGTSDSILFQKMVKPLPLASCIKVFDLLAILREGFTLKSIIDDKPGLVTDNIFSYITDEEFEEKSKLKKEKNLPPNEWLPYNWNNIFAGSRSLDYHLRWSRNIPFIYLILNHISLSKLKDLFVEFGILNPEEPLFPSGIIGSMEIHPFKYLAALATLVNRGKKIEASIIKQILVSGIDNTRDPTKKNHILWRHRNSRKRSKLLSSIDNKIYEDVLTSMRNTVFNGFCYRFRDLPFRNMYGKTGTGHDNKEASCVFMVGNIVVIASICRKDNTPLGKSVYGAFFPVICVRTIIEELIEKESVWIAGDYIANPRAAPIAESESESTPTSVE